MIYIVYDYGVNLSVVILYDVGWIKACLHAFKKWFKLRICAKKEREKSKQWGWKFSKNSIEFTIKLVMIGPLKNDIFGG